jgi:cell shape-determining protein MreC
MAILLREVLIGFVEHCHTHTARVRSVSDVQGGMKVQIGRLGDDGFRALDGYFWLTGGGGGVTEIRDIDRREVKAGRIRVGDYVLSDPMSEVLPAAMTIGRVTAIETDRKNPLLSILTVKSEVEGHSLRRVYVYVPESASDTGHVEGP